MNKLKRRIVAVLLTLSMLLSLMPALPQAAQAASGGYAEDEWVQVDYFEGDADVERSINVVVQDINGQQLSSVPLVIDDYNWGRAAKDTITLTEEKAAEYDIVGIDVSDGAMTGVELDAKNVSYAWTTMENGATLTITLDKPFEEPYVPELIETSTVSRTYRVYDEQVLKMLHANDIEVSADTEIVSVEPYWVKSFGLESDKALTDINREHDYLSGVFTSDGADVNDVQPYNIRKLEITYNNGDGEQKTSVYSGDLRYMIGDADGTKYYQIELNDDTFHVVYFYNTKDSATQTNYTLYDIAFVDDGQSIGDQMPPDPTYNDDLNDYKFVNWEINSYDGDGQAFLPTTIVDEDMTVYAHKVSSSYSGGTEIRIMDNYGGGTGQFMTRLAELYNEKHGTEITSAQINKDSIKVRVNGVDGAHTNEKYYSNAWEDDYYLVHDFDTPGVEGGLETSRNTHVGFDEVSGIVVYFTADGSDEIQTVTIPVGTNVGDLAKMMDTGLVGTNEHILQLYVIQPGEVVDQPDQPVVPDAPGYDELKDLIDVTVECTTNDSHEDATYDLIEDSFDVSAVTGSADTSYTATVTVNNDLYVDKYNTESTSGHTISGDAAKTVNVTYTDGAWVLAAGAAMPLFTVTCGTPTPGGDADITGFAKDLITADEQADVTGVASFDGITLPEKDSAVVIPYNGTVTLLYGITVSGVADATFTVTDEGATLVGRDDASVEQKDDGTIVGQLPQDGSLIFYVTMTFDKDDIDKDGYLVNTASIAGSGESSVDPEIDEEIDEKVPATPADKPDAPDDKTLKEILANGAVTIDCTNTYDIHKNETYGLIDGNYKVGNVKGSADKGFRVVVTVTPDAYVEIYSTNSHVDHQLDPVGQDKGKITLNYQDGQWVVDKETAPVLYTVICTATPDQFITGFAKDVIGQNNLEQAEEDDVSTEGYVIPESENATVTIPYDGSVKLLYSITVSGKAGTNFVVTDKGADLVTSSAGVTEDKDDDTFSGTIPEGADKVTFYVSKTFTAADVKKVDGKDVLVNSANIALQNPAGGVVEPDPEIEEKVPVDTEDQPSLPGDEELDALLNGASVKVDCTANVGHESAPSALADGTYAYVPNEVTGSEAEGFTATIKVTPDTYLTAFNTAAGQTHGLDEARTQDDTIVLSYVKGEGWKVAEDSDTAIVFYVTCDGTYAINTFTKDLVGSDDIESLPASIDQGDYVIPTVADGQTATVTVPKDGTVTLLYSITVDGQSGTDFVVTDKGATLVSGDGITQASDEDGNATFSGTIPEDATSVTFYVSRTFADSEVVDGQLINSATIEVDGEGGITPGEDEEDEEVLAEVDPDAAQVTVTPADLTIYEGGDGGYDAVVGNDGEIAEATNSLPHPLFNITAPEGIAVTDLTFTAGSSTWTVVDDGDGHYHFQQGEGQDPVRVTYSTINEDGTAGTPVLNDTFDPAAVEDSYVTYQIDLYPGNNEADFSNVKAQIGGVGYALSVDSGTLTVRAVDAADPGSVVSAIEETAPTTEVAEETAVAVEPENTIYTLNDTNVVVDEADSVPSLLFDGIIDDETDRTAMLEEKTADKLNVDGADLGYDIKYLDLVDANNGNAWIASSEGTDIYWGYPEGYDENSDVTFQIVHFKDLHRDGEQSGFDPADLENIDMENDVEIITPEKTENGLKFHVAEANFSPYALTWQTEEGGSDTPGPGPTPDPGPSPSYPSGPSLERGDHYAYIVGYEDETIRPQNNITRAEVATIFFRLLTDESREQYFTDDNSAFSDMTGDHWYDNAVATLTNAGIIAGYPDGTFRPNDPITRAEFAAIATRFDDLEPVPSRFTDIDGHWAEDAINAAYGAGWVGGYPDGTFLPNKNITRAEVMSLVNRVLDRNVDIDGMLDDMLTWVDNEPSDWFYEAVQEATNSHDYEREEGEEFETWTKITEPRDWTQLEEDLLAGLGK